MRVRLLDHNSKFDIELVTKILNDYLDEERERKFSIYFIETVESLVEKIKDGFKLGAILVTGMFDEAGKIIGCAAGVSINRLWQQGITLLPIWILLLTYLKNKHMSSPKERLHKLISPIITIFEKHKFYSWFKVTKFSHTVTNESLDDYITNVYSKIINDERYTVTVESIVTSTTDLSKLPDTYRRIFPDRIKEGVKLVLLQHHYKNSLRKFESL